MKKITILIFTILAIEFANAQVNINLIMNPRPIANINDWAGKRDIITLVASPSPIGVYPNNAKINTTIKTADGTTVAVTDMQRATVKALVRGGNTIFSTADVVNMQAMVFTGSFQNKINSTGKLPVGSYQIIVRLDSTDLPAPLSNTQTKIFFLSATQLPVLMMPAEGSVLSSASAQTAITFRWTAVAPKPVEAVRYKVQVFEVLQNQTPMQALRSNQPLIDKEVLGLTQFIWQPQLSFIEGENKKFIWTIQSFDFHQQLITGETANNEGRSEAKTFTILTTTTGKPIKNKNGL